MKYRYYTNCVSSTARLINDMRDTARDVTYRTVLRHCHGLLGWAKEMGYELRSNQGLTLKDDWHVSYHKSTYAGLPCYYVRHSAIEYIWVNRGEDSYG